MPRSGGCDDKAEGSSPYDDHHGGFACAPIRAGHGGESLSALEVVPPVAGTPAAVWSALAKVGADALTHAVLGSLLTVLALANLVLAITSGARSVALIGALAFVCIAMASANGILFTLSGFKDDHYSHGMATTFLLGFALHFIQVGILTVRLRTQVPGRSVEPS